MKTTEQKIKASMIKQFQITTLDELQKAIEEKRSVVFDIKIANQRPMPAAVLMNMVGFVIYSRFRKGTYIYQKNA